MHAQTCLFGREKHEAGVHWTPRDYSRVKDEDHYLLDMTPCSFVERCKHFGGTCYHHLQKAEHVDTLSYPEPEG
jgi:hypothetical protein